MKYLGMYLLCIGLIAAVVTIYDKWASKHNPRHRTPEKTLLLISALGGSVVMFSVMQIIRHKTKHVKFMLGIPIIIIVQAATAFALFYFGLL